MRSNELPEARLLPFDVIVAATRGESEALAQVLKHFEGYIAKMSTRIYHDEFGQSFPGVDEELRQRIECRLMAQIILKFKIQ